MAGFKYQAIANDGRIQKGVLEVDNARQARLQLREQGLIPLEVDALAGALGKPRTSFAGFGNRLSSAELNLITRQLATLFEAGLTVDQAFSALIEQADTLKQQQILAAVRGEVLAGKSLARAMDQFPAVFPQLYRTLVNAGEQSGQLSRVLSRLADYLDARHSFLQKIIQALIYPCIVSVTALCIVIGLMTYVVPQVVQVFQNTHQALPWLTRALIGASDFIRATGVYWLLALAAAGWLARRALRMPERRFAFDAFVLRIPIAGRLIRAINAARFASTLAILVGSRVPLLAALQAGAGVVRSLPMQRALEETQRMVREGAPLSRALGAGKQFPPLMVHMIASGEASGRLDDMLERVATQQGNEVEHRLATLTGLLEPLLILAMGLLVLLIVIAMLLPIFEMNQLIK
jgi:general secretion pathway protein F